MPNTIIEETPGSSTQSTPDPLNTPNNSSPLRPGQGEIIQSHTSSNEILMEEFVNRDAVFVDLHSGIINATSNFAGLRLLTARVKLSPSGELASAKWKERGFYELFTQEEGPATLSTELRGDVPTCLSSLSWQETSLTVDGRFTVQVGLGDAPRQTLWAWMLMYPENTNLAGIVVDEIQRCTALSPRAVFLPKRAPLLKASKQGGEEEISAQSTRASPKRVPIALTEAEIAANPQIYTEDPGSYGRPFSNPERIVSETSVYSIFRVDEPVLSFAASGNLQESAVFSQRYGSVTAGEMQAQMDMLKVFGSERHAMDDDNPIQWESDSLRYQASTVSMGHVIEFRIRTRNNGYSLGSVAKTLTLAPRQSKRIQKIAWSRTERARRSEQQRLADTTSEVSTKNASYSDIVSANLKEQLSGGSSAKASAAAAGFGGILGSCVFGGGAVTATASSKSWQDAKRFTTASENTKWREAIRRQGDAVRQYEATVVEEVQEDENVEGTAEVIRNLNYGHSITVIYHNILRHLRIDVDFASARECLFVPFPMRPFNDKRAYRWKESLRGILLEPQYLVGLECLKRCFYVGKGQDAPSVGDTLLVLQGILALKITIAEPKADAQGNFCADNWRCLEDYLPESPKEIWTKTHDTSQRGGPTFAANYAPDLVSKWVNKLTITDSQGGQLRGTWLVNTSQYRVGGPVQATFTLATCTPQSERGVLTKLFLKSSWILPPGSTAEIKSVSYEYRSTFSGGMRSSSGQVDQPRLTDMGQGSYSSAWISCPQEISSPRVDYGTSQEAVDDLIDHLNANIEYYHRALWWTMDRDRLFMLLDAVTFTRHDQPVSIANLVERDPIAVAGNCLVYCVSPGTYLGPSDGSISSAEELNTMYRPSTVSEPMHISLPTDGVYAQTLMDECTALEEHYGNTDWALSDKDPELGRLDRSQLASDSKVDRSDLKPTELPGSIINLSNFSSVPQPQGISGALEAVQNGQAFRDMAGLEKTQALVQSAMGTAAGLATAFGERAVTLARERQTVEMMDRKLSSIERAKNKGLITKEDAAKLTGDALSGLGSGENGRSKAIHEDPAIQKLLGGLEGDTSASKKISIRSADGGSLSIETAAKAANIPRRPPPDPYDRDEHKSNDAGEVNNEYDGITDPGIEEGQPAIDASTDAMLGNPPSWSEFATKYWTYGRKHSPDVRAAIQLNRLHRDTSCMRLSQALRDTGRAIPADAAQIADVRTFWSDVQRAFYIVDPDSMKRYLLHCWGEPDVAVTKKAGEDWDVDRHPEVRDAKGVLYFEMPDASPAAHFDLWDGVNFSAELHEDEWAVQARRYWKLADKIWIWTLV